MAESARLRRCRNGREELPKTEVRGGGREELPYPRGQGQWPGVAAGRTNPRILGAVAAWVQKGLEELSRVEGQEGWR